MGSPRLDCRVHQLVALLPDRLRLVVLVNDNDDVVRARKRGSLSAELVPDRIEEGLAATDSWDQDGELG
ncbi:MAG: hypothetical protein O2992_00215 [Gemmatimonadetes bacterium]|nr:hypothetical protein [Gemmatimonadota bacterium]